MSNSTATRGKKVGEVALVNRPKYWLARAPGGSVVLQRTKARPKPGLVGICGKTEKTKEVENEAMDKDEELEAVFAMGTFVG